MGFQELQLNKSYISCGENNIAESFLVPALKHAVLYQRSVGFFSSSVLEPIIDGVVSLSRKGGKIQLIASPQLNEEDIQAINIGYKKREEIIANAFTRDFMAEIDNLDDVKLQLLASLIAKDVLDIRIAVTNTVGMYHDKFGILEDAAGDVIVFYGSANSSINGYKNNYEKIRVVKSWVAADCESIEDEREEFRSLWNGTNPFVKVYSYKVSAETNILHAATLRQELDQSSVASVQEYMQKKAELYEHKSRLLNERVTLEQAASKQREILLQSRMELARVQSKLEADLKKASISDISARAILMLDRLQSVLYRQQIAKVEEHFRKEIRTLMRKTRFIDDIKIDDNFNIYLYRREMVPRMVLIEALTSNSEEQLKSLIGQDAVVQLQGVAGTTSTEGLLRYCHELADEAIELPIRIDQASLSNGEKQIFIMALYHSLVRLGRHEIPFIIDTPFARIDTEHRHNISRFFFSELNGQVFILSTNEEINSDHVRILEDKIAATYMLENTDNKKTVVVQDTYFEV